VVFFLLLPPLLYPAALATSWRDFKANARPIGLLAVGLVLATTVAVAAAARHFGGLSWPAAFVLGAIVSPPDAVAATAVIARFRVPRRIITILEGESLVNDATALVAYRFAIAAALSGTFSLIDAGFRFVLVALGGVAIGLMVGWLVSKAQRALDDGLVQITLSVLTPYAAYLPAERLHVSGVLAVVTAGIYLGWRAPRHLKAEVRLSAVAFWNMVVFLLNGFVFVLIGLQLPAVVGRLTGAPLGRLLVQGAVISVAAIVVRIVWVVIATWLPRALSASLRKRDPYPSWHNVALIAWTGMRGVVSLAAALAVPLTLPSEGEFPARDYILFITFCVIFATLVLQGLSLPVLIRRLGVVDDHSAEREEHTARIKANQAALGYLDQLDPDANIPPEWVQRLRGEYIDRLSQLSAWQAAGYDSSQTLSAPDWLRLQQEALDIERRTVIELRDEYVINDEVLRRIQRDLDYAEARLHHSQPD
jgi:CPA1 family monovalent cation:H+ antiporter